MAVTIKDVAKETRLAISTISKYMNGGNVLPENQQKIDEAIKKLGFRPNDNARGLRNSKNYTIGLLIDSLGNQYFAKITELIQNRLKEEGYSMLVCCHQDNADTVKKALKFLQEKQVDGIILEPLMYKQDYVALLRLHNIPVVTIDRTLNYGSCDAVMSNSATGMYQATEYLIRNNHKKIAIITGISDANPGLTAAKDRYKGYLRAMEDYALPVDENFILSGNFKFESGYECMQKLWNRKERPTALIISNYNMCLGAMTAIHNMKINIPTELSFITFDDMEFSVISNPMLTSIRQPVEKIVEETVKLILRRIEGDYSDYPKNIKLPTELMIRDSVKKLE